MKAITVIGAAAKTVRTIVRNKPYGMTGKDSKTRKAGITVSKGAGAITEGTPVNKDKTAAPNTMLLIISAVDK
jgi:hypothetical protein